MLSLKASGPQASVQALSDTTTATMRAHLQFPSAATVVRALLHNALDAGAKKIVLTADLSTGSIECSDDGLGFAPAFFFQDPNTPGQRSMSWAQAHVRSFTGRYGSKQESLQLMAYLGRVSIRSTPDSCSDECFLRIQRGDRCIFSGKDGPSPLSSLKRGSNVCVSELFANLPVRRRTADMSWNRRAETNKIRAVVKAVSLREPQVSFTLQLRNQGVVEDMFDTSRSRQDTLRIHRTTSIQSRFVDVHGRSSVNSADLIDFNYATSDPDGLALQGFFSIVPSSSRDMQYIYVNKHPLVHGSSLMEHLSGASIMSSRDEAQDGSSMFVNATSHRSLIDVETDLYSTTATVLQHAVNAFPGPTYEVPDLSKEATLDTSRGSPTKASTSFPVFYLDVTIGLAALNKRGNLSQNQRPSPLSLKSILQERIIQALRLRTSQSRIGSPFWDATAVQNHCEPDCGSPSRFSPLKGSKHTMPSQDTEPSIVRANQAETDLVPSPGTSGARLTDRTQFDSRSAHRPRAALDASALGSYRLSHRQCDGPKEQGATPAWLDAATSVWRNPALPLPREADIPTMGLLACCSKEAPNPARKRKHSSHQEHHSSKRPQSASSALSPRSQLWRHSDRKVKMTSRSKTESPEPDVAHSAISKDAIRLSRVIGQVDRKFILCSTDISTESSLGPARPPTMILIDQHAADERIRVEFLVAEYARRCRESRPDLHQLPKPVCCDINPEEAASLQGDGIGQLILLRAGFDVKLEDVPTRDAQDTIHRLSVRAVPAIVKNRLISDPFLAVGLVKAFIAVGMGPQGPVLLSHLQGSDEKTQEESNRSLGWLKILRTVPRLMLDLINSRACRGAIMFNDVLGQDQCESLVQRLSETVFPFQCAHGRPSMLPLTHLSHNTYPPAAHNISWHRLKQLK